MGLGIHYSGKFKPEASLSGLIAEVEALANLYGWEHVVYNDTFPSMFFGNSYSDCIYGIAVIPPCCDPIFLSFLSNGRMSSPLHLESFGYSTELIHNEYLYLLSVNTFDAGVEVHIKVVDMLKLVSEKYLTNFEVNDEGGYWESGNKVLLTEAFYHRMQLVELMPHQRVSATWTSSESIRQYLNHVMVDLIHKQ